MPVEQHFAHAAQQAGRAVALAAEPARDARAERDDLVPRDERPVERFLEARRRLRQQRGIDRVAGDQEFGAPHPRTTALRPISSRAASAMRRETARSNSSPAARP